MRCNNNSHKSRQAIFTNYFKSANLLFKVILFSIEKLQSSDTIPVGVIPHHEIYSVAGFMLFKKKFHEKPKIRNKKQQRKIFYSKIILFADKKERLYRIYSYLCPIGFCVNRKFVFFATLIFWHSKITSNFLLLRILKSFYLCNIAEIGE